METWSTRTLSSMRSSLKDVSQFQGCVDMTSSVATRNSTMKYTVGNDTECTTSIYNELDETVTTKCTEAATLTSEGVVFLPERPNHTTRMVRPRGVLEIMHYCLITPAHTTTHLPRQHASAPRTSWRFGGSSSCLDESSHPWVPAGHPQHAVPHTEEGCGWLSNTHRHKESKPPQTSTGIQR